MGDGGDRSALMVRRIAEALANAIVGAAALAIVALYGAMAHAQAVDVGVEISADVSARHRGTPLLVGPRVAWRKAAWTWRWSMASEPSEPLRSRGVCVSVRCDDHVAGMAAHVERALWEAHGAWQWRLAGQAGIAWRRLGEEAWATELSTAVAARRGRWRLQAVPWLRVGVTAPSSGNRSRWGAALGACWGRVIGPCVQSGISAPLEGVREQWELPLAAGAHLSLQRLRIAIYAAMPRAFGPQQFLQTRYLGVAVIWHSGRDGGGAKK